MLSDLRPLRVTALVRGFENGADYWRAVEPFSLARECAHDCYVAMRGRPIVHPPDIVIFRGEFFAPDDLDSFVRQCELDQVLTVLDYDDLYEEWAGFENARPPGYTGSVKEAMRHFVRKVHLVTTTTHRLAQEITARTGRADVAVLENYINANNWRHLNAPNPSSPLLAVVGGDSHTADWANVPDTFLKLASEHPTLRFRVAGHDPGWCAMIAERLGDRFEYREFVRFAEYPRVGFEGATIVWAPLADNDFSRCRSPIRHWEATLAGAAFIGSPRLYHQSVRDGETGFLTDDPEVVVRLGLHLSANETDRARAVSLARQDVRGHYLTPEAVDARMAVYYLAWQARYNKEYFDGTGTSADLWTPDQQSRRRTAEVGRGAYIVRSRHRPVLSRDRPEGSLVG